MTSDCAVFYEEMIHCKLKFMLDSLCFQGGWLKRYDDEVVMVTDQA